MGGSRGTTNKKNKNKNKKEKNKKQNSTKKTIIITKTKKGIEQRKQ